MKLQQAIKTENFKSPQHMASLNILYTAYWFKCHLSESLKEVRLTVEQFNVLRILKGKHPEPMCIKDIAMRMVEKSSNVPRIINRLVAKNFVKRTSSEIDKRETIITLTRTGLKQLEMANQNLDKFHDKLFGITEEEALLLNELLEKFRIMDNDHLDPEKGQGTCLRM
jgi:DNA-binding MarR family transcriptional regulator